MTLEQLILWNKKVQTPLFQIVNDAFKNTILGDYLFTFFSLHFI